MQNNLITFDSYDKPTHVMLDLETLSTAHNAAIIQLAAVQFNPMTGEVLDKFNAHIYTESCLLWGMTISKSTVEFWQKQEAEAQNMILFAENKKPLHEALIEFKQFLNNIGHFNDVTLWGNGPAFDMSKLAAAYELCGMEKPWKYSNERCVRTLSALMPKLKYDIVFTGTKHDGIADSEHQIKYVHQILAELRNNLYIKQETSDN